MINCFIIIILLIHCSFEQASLMWSNPKQGLEANILNLIVGSSVTSPKLTNVGVPTVILGLSSLKNAKSNIAIFQQPYVMTAINFVHKLTISDPSHSVSLLQISYAAIDLTRFNFFYPFSMQIQPRLLSNSSYSNSKTETIQIQYLSVLNSSKNYTITTMLTGFNITTNTPMIVGVDIELYTTSSFLLILIAQSGLLNDVQFSRFLIDETVQAAQTQGLKQLQINYSKIYHFSSQLSVFEPERIDFYLFSSFYSIIEFDQNFKCLINDSVNIAPDPPVNLTIGLIVFMELICQSGFPMYQSVTQTCFKTCGVRLYNSNATQCGLCYGACYNCTGPAQSDCTHHLQIEAHNTTSLVCNSNYLNLVLTNHCLNCWSYVIGCISCLTNGSCLGCISNCTLINQSYCDCSPVCPQPFFLNPVTLACECPPQYYQFNSSCLSCYHGCYICQGSAYNCFACIDGYQLIMASCVLFLHTTFLLDNNLGAIALKTRCIQLYANFCITYCESASFMYQDSCYLRECPSSSFPIKDYFGNRICQLCPYPCIECDIYEVCKKCFQTGYFLTPHGLCISCPPLCTDCSSDGTICLQCMEGSQLSANGTCKQLIPQIPSSCGFGCPSCLIQSYCQECAPGYFRQGDSLQCDKCEGNGLILSNYVLVEGAPVKLCLDICGDGYAIFDGCDDGNTKDGDGCSSSCKIQQGYTCQYPLVPGPCLCYKSNFQVDCEFNKDLTENKINITLQGVNIFLSVASFNYSCEQSMKLNHIYRQAQSITYYFEYNSSVENLICTFKAVNSLVPEDIICNITTEPAALYYYTDHIMKNIKTIMEDWAKPLAYVMWGLTILGMDPYDILINNLFIFVYLATLYEFPYQPSNVYVFFSSLRNFSFDSSFINHQLKNNGYNCIAPCWKILALMGAIIVFHQVIVRIMKNRKFCPHKINKIFQSVFANRLILYVCVYTSFEPIIVLYMSSVLSLSPINVMGVVISATHIGFSVTTCILLVYNLTQLQIKSHVKYTYLVLLVKQLVIFQPFIIYLGTDYLFVSGCMLLVSAIFFILLTIFDQSSEEGQKLVNLGQYIDHLSSDPSEPELITIQHENKLSFVKGLCRKINILVQFIGFAFICLLRIICVDEYNTYSSAQTLGLIINIIFLFVNLIGGTILNIISQCLSLAMILNKGEENPPQLEQSKRNDRPSQMTNNKIFEGNDAGDHEIHIH